MEILITRNVTITRKPNLRKKGRTMFALFNRNNMKAKKAYINTADIEKQMFFRAYDQYNGVIVLSPDEIDEEYVTTVEEMDMFAYIGDNLKSWLAENEGEWGVQYFRMNGKIFIVNPMKNLIISSGDKAGYARFLIQ